jgi:hypothetical protein
MTQGIPCWAVPCCQLSALWHLQDNFKKYGNGSGFVTPELAKSILSAGPSVPVNGTA